MAPVMEEPPTLSTLVTLTSFWGVRLSLSVALLLPVLVSLAAVSSAVGGVGAVAPGGSEAVAVEDTLPAGGVRGRLSRMAPETWGGPLALRTNAERRAGTP